MARVAQSRIASELIARRTGRHTLYDVLQVSARAELSVIQAAYRALARANHPDLNTSPEAAERMREINEAYDLLSDPRRRAIYDLGLNQNRSPEDESAPQDALLPREFEPPRCQNPDHKRRSLLATHQRATTLAGWTVALVLGLGWLLSSLMPQVLAFGAGAGG